MTSDIIYIVNAYILRKVETLGTQNFTWARPCRIGRFLHLQKFDYRSIMRRIKFGFHGHLNDRENNFMWNGYEGIHLHRLNKGSSSFSIKPFFMSESITQVSISDHYFNGRNFLGFAFF